MSIVPGSMDTGTWHPSWCDRKHRRGVWVHERKVGVDLELNAGVAFGVGLQHVDLGESPTEVMFMEAAAKETSLTRLSLVEAAILRDLLSEALALAGR
jgi:hypothetical protein